MKLPAFEEFEKAMYEGKFAFEPLPMPISLKPNPKHSEVVEYTRVLSHLTAINLLRQYHAWLTEHYTPDKPQ